MQIITKLKFKSDIFNLSNKFIQKKKQCIISFYIYKLSKHLSAKYYKESKERIQKILAKDIKFFLKKKKKKSDNMVENVTKISYKTKHKSLLIQKNILQNEKKCLIIIIRNYYFKNNNLKSSFEKYKDAE